MHSAPDPPINFTALAANPPQIYNYFRDYDPQTGRYIESDPIGLKGGINTYIYTGADPLRRADPQGLTWKCETFGVVTRCLNTPPLADPEIRDFSVHSQPWLGNSSNSEVCPVASTDKAGRKVSPAAQSMAPPGDCKPDEQERMQQAVNNACKRPRSCKPGQLPVEMTIMKENARECAIARDRINSVCFMGGDVGHRNAAIDAWQGVANCDGIIP